MCVCGIFLECAVPGQKWISPILSAFLQNLFHENYRFWSHKLIWQVASDSVNLISDLWIFIAALTFKVIILQPNLFLVLWTTPLENVSLVDKKTDSIEILFCILKKRTRIVSGFYDRPPKCAQLNFFACVVEAVLVVARIPFEVEEIWHSDKFL